MEGATKHNECTEIKDLKTKLFEQQEIIELAFLELEKAHLIMSYWAQRYGNYREIPDPRAALSCGKAIGREKGTHETQSFMWFWEYKQITGFVVIAADYVVSAKKRLWERVKDL